MKRVVVLAATLGVVTLGSTAPALAVWTAGADSVDASGFAKAGTLGVAGPISATRVKVAGGNYDTTFTITSIPASGIAGEGYKVVETVAGGQACTIVLSVGSSCTMNNAAPGTKEYRVTTYAGTWVGPLGRLCEFKANDTTATCS